MSRPPTRRRERLRLTDVPLSKATTQGAREQERRHDDRPGERHKGRNRGKGDHQEPNQGETRHDQEDERPPNTTTGIHSNP